MGPKKEVEASEEVNAASASASVSDAQTPGTASAPVYTSPEHPLRVSLVMLPCVVGAKRPLTGSLAVARHWPRTRGSAALFVCTGERFAADSRGPCCLALPEGSRARRSCPSLARGAQQWQCVLFSALLCDFVGRFPRRVVWLSPLRFRRRSLSRQRPCRRKQPPLSRPCLLL